MKSSLIIIALMITNLAWGQFNPSSFIKGKEKDQFETKLNASKPESVKLEIKNLTNNKNFELEWDIPVMPVSDVDPEVAHEFKMEAMEVINSLERYKDDILDDTSLPNTQKNNIVKELKKHIDTLKQVRAYYYNINYFLGNPKWRTSFFPIRYASSTDFFYTHLDTNSVEAFSNTALQLGENKSIVATDLLTGYIGVFRVRLSSTFYNANDTDTSEALIEKVYNGGGLFALNANYPLFYRKGTYAKFMLDANLRFSGDVNAFGTELPKDDLVGYFEPSLSAYLELSFNNQGVSVFGNLKAALLYGTKAFDRVIFNQARKGSFAVTEIYAGINFSNRLRLGAIIPIRRVAGLGGADSFSVGIQYTPKN